MDDPDERPLNRPINLDETLAAPSQIFPSASFLSSELEMEKSCHNSRCVEPVREIFTPRGMGMIRWPRRSFHGLIVCVGRRRHSSWRSWRSSPPSSVWPSSFWRVDGEAEVFSSLSALPPPLASCCLEYAWVCVCGGQRWPRWRENPSSALRGKPGAAKTWNDTLYLKPSERTSPILHRRLTPVVVSGGFFPIWKEIQLLFVFLLNSLKRLLDNPLRFKSHEITFLQTNIHPAG